MADCKENRAWLSYLRQANRLSRQEMADALGISFSMYRKTEDWDRYKTMPEHFKDALSEVLHIPVYIINGYENGAIDPEEAAMDAAEAELNKTPEMYVEPPLVTLGRNYSRILRHWLAKNRRGIDWLAREAHVDYKRLVKYITQKEPPTLEELLRTARVIRIPIDAFFRI